jgi:hypothetical protein
LPATGISSSGKPAKAPRPVPRSVHHDALEPLLDHRELGVVEAELADHLGLDLAHDLAVGRDDPGPEVGRSSTPSLATAW